MVPASLRHGEKGSLCGVHTSCVGYVQEVVSVSENCWLGNWQPRDLTRLLGSILSLSFTSKKGMIRGSAHRFIEKLVIGTSTISRRAPAGDSIISHQQIFPAGRIASFFSTEQAPVEEEKGGLDPRLFLHHGQRPRFRNRKKFESPRKKANKLMAEICKEAIDKSKANNPKVFETKFRVGDAIEMEIIVEGGIKSDKTEKVRGVVTGIYNQGIDTSVLLRDVVYGSVVERKVPLHSPLIKYLKVLEENFIYKGKRKVKRAKLHYLRDRNPLRKYLLRAFHLFSSVHSSNTIQYAV